MSGVNKTPICVVRRTRIVMLRRLSRARSHAYAIRCGTKGSQQFAIELKHVSCGQGPGSMRAAKKIGGLVGELRRRVIVL
jgi:hypothetical protein